MKKERIRNILLIAIILLLMPLEMVGNEKRDSVVVSLITCAPGAEIYELCGHEAIRVRSERMDSVWNYGVFDFKEPNFVYRFVKGETDYMLAGYPFAWFLPEYQSSGRKVVEQELNLSNAEAIKLLNLLREESKPENCRYRYNYVKDNCATRILERMDSAVSGRIIYPDSIKYSTFRKEMRAYHAGYPWYQFGIDLALGSGLDLEIRGRDEMFVPIEMCLKVAGAHITDGRKLVRATRVLNEGEEDATLPATSWYATPLACSIALLLLSIVLALWMSRKKRILRVVYSVWFGVCGIAGMLIAFLVFVSTHEATDPNMLIIWLNPLQILFAISVWGRKVRYLSLAMACYNVLAEGILLLLWPFQAQVANVAFFPLLGVTLLLSGVYLYVEPSERASKRENRVNMKNVQPRRRVATKYNKKR